MVPSCTGGPSPPSDVNYSLFPQITSGEGPTYLKVTCKGQIIAFRQTHIEKTTYLDTLDTSKYN